MIDVRDAMLEILDQETLAELAAREGQASIDPRGRHADALEGAVPDPGSVAEQAPQGGLDPILERAADARSASAARDASRASPSE